MALKHKDILGLRTLSQGEILEILDTAEIMKYILKQNSKRTPTFWVNPLWIFSMRIVLGLGYPLN